MNKAEIPSPSQKVEFVFPLYYHDLPKIVFEFIRKINLNKADYVFAHIMRAGDDNGVAIYQINQLLTSKLMKPLDAEFFVQMPNNYIIQYPSNPFEL